MKHSLLLFAKGIAMGAANVIPGVSGGTIAFVTGIYQEFIDSLKSFDSRALQLATKLRMRDLAKHLNLAFLLPLGLGVLAALISLVRLLEWLFAHWPIYVWSFFFGLVFASVYFVSKNIKRASVPAVIAFAAGAAIALSMAFIRPATENDSFLYLVLCGTVAMCSMILPGLSGSFVLILMGNYQLIAIQAISERNLGILFPVAIGAVIGFVCLSRLISYLLRRFHDTTLGSLTGFILGSLVVIWPWKNELYLTEEGGLPILKEGERIVQGYRYYAPEIWSAETWIAAALTLAGIASVILLEKTAQERA